MITNVNLINLIYKFNLIKTLKSAVTNVINIYSSFDANIQYIEIPLTIGYKLNINDNLYLIPRIGGFVDFGLNNSKAVGITADGETVNDLYVFLGKRKYV